MFPHLDVADRRVLVDAHDRGDLFAEPRVRQSDDCRFEGAEMREQTGFDLGGVDVLPAADDDVLEPADDDEVAVEVETAEILVWNQPAVNDGSVSSGKPK